ncbi:MAG: hypothetical protein H6939_04410 [Burkholderiales bacterium]|nr:hypothetical protein [Burkholderiales bacterium]
MSDYVSLDEYFLQRVETRAIHRKYEAGDCFSKPELQGYSAESLYLNQHFHERLAEVRADKRSKSTILCVPIPGNGSIPEILNKVFNISAVSRMVGMALGTAERPVPQINVPIDHTHAFFEAEMLEGDESGEDNRQEIRATGVLKFFDLIPDWLADNLDASVVPFEDRWLATLDINLKSTGHIMVSPIPLGMQVDPQTNRRIVVTSFMSGIVNTNEDVPYPLEVELDYDPALSFLDDDTDIPGAGQKTLMAIHEIYDSGNTLDEQIATMHHAEREQSSFVNNVIAQVIPANQSEQEIVTRNKMIRDDALMEVELSFSGHRKDVIDLTLEQQVVVYVEPRYLEFTKTQLGEDPVFLTAELSLSAGLYNPGAPPDGHENSEVNDYLQFYLNIKEANGASLQDAIVLHGGPLLKLAKLRLPGHLPGKKPQPPDAALTNDARQRAVLFDESS